MITIRHRFLDHPINPETETLIIGTFNPETAENDAEFFYGRSRNFLWQILPVTFKETSLKGAPKANKLAFIQKHKIDLIDLIEEIQVEEDQQANYLDSYIDMKVTTWRDVISIIQTLKNLKRVCFSRKTFSGIPKMKKQIEIIQAYCEESNILFKVLPTPSRFYSSDKQIAWEKFILGN